MADDRWNREADVVAAGMSTRALIEASEPVLQDLRMTLFRVKRVLADLEQVDAQELDGINDV